MDLKDSLERESQKTRDEMHQRFGALEQRLDRQSGMLVAGTRVLARFEYGPMPSIPYGRKTILKSSPSIPIVRRRLCA